MAAWVVRCGRRGQKGALDRFEENSVAAIGWEIGDLSQINGREEIKKKLWDLFPESSDRQVSNWAGTIYSFGKEISVGDLILTPSTTSSEVLIGRCEGAYEYWPQWESLRDGGSYEGVRRVNWRRKVAREEFSESLRENLRSLLTVSKIKERNINEILAHIGEEGAYPGGDPGVPPSPPAPEDPWSPDNIEALAEHLLWSPPHLQEIIADLQEKHQVIFYGPPGTGKTYVAREIARQCEDNGGGFEIVQFHPSYSYEDFVQGFRPRLHNGQPGFGLVDGPLLRIAERARANPDATFILLIDELNRGNVAKVFGELYFLLEYRDEAVLLQYGGDAYGFSLPSNLWFICTMNTADRSIALMDAALRRRFYFAPFFPDEPPVKGLLRRWLAKHGQDTWAADLVDAANSKLDRDMGIGPSYFMGAGQTLDESRVRRIWKRAVVPYVEEQCFGDKARLEEFEFDHLIGRLDRLTAMGDGPGKPQLAEETDPPRADDAAADAS